MSEFAALIYSSSQAFKVQLSQSADKGFSKTINVDSSNAMILQEVLVSQTIIIPKVAPYSYIEIWDLY